MQPDARKSSKRGRLESARLLCRVVLGLSCGFLFSLTVQAKDIVTNEVTMTNAPDWLKQPRVEKATDHITMRLKPTGQRASVTFYKTEAEYDKAVPYGAASLAVTKYDGGVASLHIGPQVNETNFDEVFGHELVHVILFQRYKGTVPKWLEEGLANHLSSKNKVDYKWLAKETPIDDVHHLEHPFSGSPSQIQYRYVASQAFCEMLENKCQSLENLVNKSGTGEMENYMKTMCNLTDLNTAFQNWVKQKAKG